MALAVRGGGRTPGDYDRAGKRRKKCVAEPSPTPPGGLSCGSVLANVASILILLGSVKSALGQVGIATTVIGSPRSSAPSLV